MTLALVGLAAGHGRRHPRFAAENLTQVAGSYGGVAFMVLAVLFILVTVALLAWPPRSTSGTSYRDLPSPRTARCGWRWPSPWRWCLSLLTFWLPMRSGVRALDELG